MEVVDGDDIPAPIIWAEYKDIIGRYELKNNGIEHMKRFSFYERAKAAYAIVATGESAIYANIILKKGIIT